MTWTEYAELKDLGVADRPGRMVWGIPDREEAIKLMHRCLCVVDTFIDNRKNKKLWDRLFKFVREHSNVMPRWPGNKPLD